MSHFLVIMRNSCCQLFPVCIYDGTYVCHRCNMVPFQNLFFFLSASVQKMFEAHTLAKFFLYVAVHMKCYVLAANFLCSIGTIIAV